MEDDGWVERVLAARPDSFGRVMASAAEYRFQVLVSRVVSAEEADQRGCPGSSSRSGSGGPCRRLVRHGYRVDAEYFYPASAIKLGAAVAAVEKLERLQLPEGQRLHLSTPVSFLPLLEGDEEKRRDSTNLSTNDITLAHEIRKLFLVSDNEAFDRLYALVGHRCLNQIMEMWDKGLKSARFHHRLSTHLSPALNRFCEPVAALVDDGPYVMAPKQSRLRVPDNSSLSGVMVGRAHVTENGDLIEEPMDFSQKNYMKLRDLQDLLVKLVRPDVELGTAALKIDEGFRMMLLEAMSQYPASSSNPSYDVADYPDDYCKFFLPGVARVRSKGAIRIYNKIGRAYGFTIENAYILDIETGEGFFLSAVIYTNGNGTLNDDIYEYEETADKVMADLGQAIAEELWKDQKCTAKSKVSAFDLARSNLATITLSRQVCVQSELDEKSFLCDHLVPGDERQLETGDNRIESVTGENLAEQQTNAPVGQRDERSTERPMKSCYQFFIDE